MHRTTQPKTPWYPTDVIIIFHELYNLILTDAKSTGFYFSMFWPSPLLLWCPHRKWERARLEHGRGAIGHSSDAHRSPQLGTRSRVPDALGCPTIICSSYRIPWSSLNGPRSWA